MIEIHFLQGYINTYLSTSTFFQVNSKVKNLCKNISKGSLADNLSGCNRSLRLHVVKKCGQVDHVSIQC